VATVADPVVAVVTQAAAQPEGIKEDCCLESPYVTTPPDIPAQYAVGARKWQGSPSIECAPPDAYGRLVIVAARGKAGIITCCWLALFYPVPAIGKSAVGREQTAVAQSTSTPDGVYSGG
jgi:hypothetical protein